MATDPTHKTVTVCGHSHGFGSILFVRVLNAAWIVGRPGRRHPERPRMKKVGDSFWRYLRLLTLSDRVTCLKTVLGFARRPKLF